MRKYIDMRWLAGHHACKPGTEAFVELFGDAAELAACDAALAALEAG